MSSELALEVKNVHKNYGDFAAAAGISFSVPKGVIYGVLGPNGAGKTTTLRMVNDILAPDRGEIRIFGDLPPGREASQRIGYLPEERGLYPKMKVVELLQFFAELRGLPTQKAVSNSEAWLQKLGLVDWAQKRVQDLSKGMQQKVQFAASLIHEPDLLILDEPWSGLDPINAEILQKTVLDAKAQGRTVVFSTHQMEQAEKICDYVCIIAKGKVVLAGQLDEIKSAASSNRLVNLELGSVRDEDAAKLVWEDKTLVSRAERAKTGFDVELAESATAEHLLTKLISAQVSVKRFERVEPTLHQIFVDRVSGQASADMDDRKVNAASDRG